MSKYYVIVHRDELTTTIQENLGYSLSSGVTIFNGEEPTDYIILPIPNRVAHRSLREYRKFTRAEVIVEQANVRLGIYNNKIRTEQGLPQPVHSGISATYGNGKAILLAESQGVGSFDLVFPDGYISGMETHYNNAEPGDTVSMTMGYDAGEGFVALYQWCTDWYINGTGTMDEGSGNHAALPAGTIIRVTVTKGTGNIGSTWVGCNPRYWVRTT